MLPDRSPHRAALLLATGLIMHGLDRMRSSTSGGRILYIGSTIGIRRQLQSVAVGSLSLDDVFSQMHISRASAGTLADRASASLTQRHLPTVISVYSPANPVAVCQRWAPEWIAIDCGDQSDLEWLKPVLEFSRMTKTPIVAWSENLLSDAVSEFRRSAVDMFVWPAAISTASNPEAVTNLTPVVMAGANVDQLEAPLHKALQLVAEASRFANSRLERDAVCLAWRYFRCIEYLAVPLDRYEAESSVRWGLPSLARLAHGHHKFVEAVRPLNSRLAEVLDEASVYLRSALNLFHSDDPPLWRFLGDLCVANVPDGLARVIVFPSLTRKQLFGLSLLSKYNISDDDLRELRIWLMSAKDLRRLAIHQQTGSESGDASDLPDPSWRVEVFIVGVPSPRLSAHYEPALRQETVKFVLYPHQVNPLMHTLERWRQALELDITANLEALTRLGGSRPRSAEPPKIKRVKLQDTQSITTASRDTISHLAGSRRLWEPTDSVEEISRLLAEDMEGVEEVEHENHSPIDRGEAGTSEHDWIDEAVEVQFHDGNRALFAPDETINVIYRGAEGDEVRESYVRALQRGDRVLFIHGQRRQSLYSLVISRVHRHPSIELHLALVRRWQEDSAAAFRSWQQREHKTTEDLLIAIRRKGSQLESPLTLRMWLRGDTLAPQDPEDLRRLAEILELKFVGEYYVRISRAASRLRGLHRGLANRLNRWIKDQAAGESPAQLSGIFDEELGLSLQDFRDSLVLLRVEFIKPLPGPFLRTTLGHLTRADVA